MAVPRPAHYCAGTACGILYREFGGTAARLV
jgi:hypothetical protein